MNVAAAYDFQSVPHVPNVRRRTGHLMSKAMPINGFRLVVCTALQDVLRYFSSEPFRVDTTTDRGD